MSEGNKVLARRVADDIVNPGNVDAVVEIYAPDYVLHDPSMPEDVHGVEGIREFYETVFNAFPDTELSIEELIAEGDKVVQRVGPLGALTEASIWASLRAVSGWKVRGSPSAASKVARS